MRYLVMLSLFNLVLFGLPVGWLGLMAMIFGVGLAATGEPFGGLALVFLASCGILFFISHFMTLIAAAKLRKFDEKNLQDAAQ
jgi:hypothetical protein